MKALTSHKTRNILRPLVIVCSLTLDLCSCGQGLARNEQHHPASHFVAKDYSEKLILAPQAIDFKDKFKKFWNASGASLWLSSNQSLFLNEALPDKNFALVTVGSKNALTALSFAAKIIATSPGNLAASTVALVAWHSTAELDAIAKIAHSHDSLGLSCGRVEVLPDLSQGDQGFGLTTVDEPTLPIFNETVKIAEIDPLVAATNASRIRTDIESMVALGTRFHSSTGAAAATAAVHKMFADAGASIPGFVVTDYQHTKTSQASVIATIPGSSDDTTTIILGSHLDSVNANEKPSGIAPGADDNASGVATLAEVIRVLAAKGTRFQRRIEFHAYAAEEVGLVGSSEIATAYRQQGRKVAAMLQVDMNSYSTLETTAQTIFLVVDWTSDSLRRSLKDLLNTYLGGNYIEKRLLAGTSDHKAWTVAGYQAVFPFEDPASHNPHLHTPADTVANANAPALSERFAKLIIAFLGHHAGMGTALIDPSSPTPAPRPPTMGDIKLGIVRSTTYDEDYLVATGPLAVAQMSYCLVKTAADQNCTGNAVPLTMVRETAAANGKARRFFVTDTAFNAAAPNIFRVQGYDQNDVMVAMRTVSFKKK